MCNRSYDRIRIWAGFLFYCFIKPISGGIGRGGGVDGGGDDDDDDDDGTFEENSGILHEFWFSLY
jgi:hypothetical protein